MRAAAGGTIWRIVFRALHSVNRDKVKDFSRYARHLILLFSDVHSTSFSYRPAPQCFRIRSQAHIDHIIIPCPSYPQLKTSWSCYKRHDTIKTTSLSLKDAARSRSNVLNFFLLDRTLVYISPPVSISIITRIFVP